ncbi:MAG: DAK2 domain-containing protein [Geminicoccaceae bacterium]
MKADLQERVLDAVCRTLDEHAAQFDALDEAIGDGDHGTNLKRVGAAIAAKKKQLVGGQPGEMLKALAALVRSEGSGAGGTYYAALLQGMAETAPEGAVDLPALVRMLDAGVEAVQDAGGARKGDKTMLDVLVPVADALRTAVAHGRTDELGGRLIAAAGHGLHHTSRIEAKKGLAADLGPASVNHLDPGACSSALLIGAVVAVFEPRA